MEKINCDMKLCVWIFPLLCHYMRLSDEFVCVCVRLNVPEAPSQKFPFLHQSCLPKKRKRRLIYEPTHAHRQPPRAHTIFPFRQRRKGARAQGVGCDRGRGNHTAFGGINGIDIVLLVVTARTRLYDTPFRLGTISRGDDRRGGFFNSMCTSHLVHIHAAR